MDDNRIHPTAVIGPEVELGTGNVIGPFAVLQGRVRVGDGNFFASHTSIGGGAEVHGVDLEASWEEPSTAGGVVIGSHNVFKEFLTLNTGWQGQTVIGDRGYFMGKVHFGHDAVVGDGVTISCAALVGGHTIIEDGATIGLGAALHQRLVVGAGCMIGMQAAVTRDVPPYTVSMGAPAKPSRLNTYRLDKLGLAEEQHAAIAAVALEGGDDVSAAPAEVREGLQRWVDRRDSR